MAKDTDSTERRKPRNRDIVVSTVSLASLVSVIGGVYKIDDYVNKIIENRISVLKPNGDYIRQLAREECLPAIARTNEEVERSRKECERWIEQVMRFNDRRGR